MLVKTIMLTSDKLNLVTLNTPIKNALDIMENKSYLSIPVVDGNEFKGVISKHDIYKYYFNKGIDKDTWLNKEKVSDLVKNNIPIINEQVEIEKAVSYLEKMSIAFVAVVNDSNEFTGILTHKAVFREFINAVGLNGGEKITILSQDVPGQISKISKIILSYQGDITSFIVLDTKSLTQVKEVVIRIDNGNIDEIKKKLKESGFKIV